MRFDIYKGCYNMNEDKNNSIVSVHESEEVSHKDAAVSTDSKLEISQGETSTWSTYESFSWFLGYSKMFTKRLLKDLAISLMAYVYAGQLLPCHIADLMSVQQALQSERESQTVTYRSEETGLLCTPTRDFQMKDREPMFVIVDSSCVSNPSSREILIENINNRPTPIKKLKVIKPIDMPSTSADMSYYNNVDSLKRTDSTDELLMVDINLQSENEIPVDEIESENESVVISYLRNKSILDLEGAILSAKRKANLLEDVPKMETIVEDEQFNAFPFNPNDTKHNVSSEDEKESE